MSSVTVLWSLQPSPLCRSLLSSALPFPQGLGSSPSLTASSCIISDRFLNPSNLGFLILETVGPSL